MHKQSTSSPQWAKVCETQFLFFDGFFWSVAGQIYSVISELFSPLSSLQFSLTCFISCMLHGKLYSLQAHSLEPKWKPGLKSRFMATRNWLAYSMQDRAKCSLLSLNWGEHEWALHLSNSVPHNLYIYLSTLYVSIDICPQHSNSSYSFDFDHSIL